MARVVASIEARMASSRLPGKVLADIAGKPALQRLLDRLYAAQQIDAIVLATTTGEVDDPLAQWANDAGLPCHRGSEDDVLRRVVEAQQSMSSDVVVEINGDMPLLDPAVVDRAVERFFQGGCDVVSTTWKPSYPQGIDAQVFRLEDLERVANTIQDPTVREHVSLYFYEHPKRYQVVHLEAPPRLRRPDVRLVLDYAEDLDLIRAVYERLEPGLGGAFGVEEVLALLDREPVLAAINRHCEELSAR
ncbi:MAG TPA: glycosyltransferase family protein [Rhodospirillales bacterium]|jgi:spore coat polysaccharide biosynthesis protein SpsF|nr:glycosyltransferase family protein [Rhodospirillales bacterium]